MPTSQEGALRVSPAGCAVSGLVSGRVFPGCDPSHGGPFRRMLGFQWEFNLIREQS